MKEIENFELELLKDMNNEYELYYFWVIKSIKYEIDKYIRNNRFYPKEIILKFPLVDKQRGIALFFYNIRIRVNPESDKIIEVK